MNARLSAGLERLRRLTDVAARVAGDPVGYVRGFTEPRDMEVAGWLACALAFGQSSQFRATLEEALGVLRPSPWAFALAFDPARDSHAFAGLRHRWMRGEDIAALLYILREAAGPFGSVGALFVSLCREEDPDVGPALERFVEALSVVDTRPVYGRRLLPRGLNFLARPSSGSACKRLNLYLRWMVRPDDGVDLGLWSGVSPSKLVVPLDAHVFRLSRYLGLTRRRTPGWPAAMDVTRALRAANPEDPLRFDFPLCHHGMSGACPTGRDPERCRVCPLAASCAKGRALLR